MKLCARKVLTEQGWRENMALTVENGIITEIAPCEEENIPFDRLTSGLFDLHVHGGHGYNTENCDWEALKHFLLWEVQNGVTDVLLTISTTSPELYHHCIPFIREAMERQKNGELPGAVIQGIHLEGPFLSHQRLGAMLEEQVREATVEYLMDIVCGSLDGIRLVSLAPEIPGAEEVTRYLLEHGVCVQAGHTNATFEEAQAGFSWGINSLCHSFNACRPIHHRDPGVVTAALLNPEVYCETICDLNHLHPATIHLIHHCKGWKRMCVISDSITTTGLPDGRYFTKLGKEIIVKDGCMRVAGGALDGGVCTIGQAMKNLHGIGIPDEDAFYSASLIPAQRTRMDQLGIISVGKTAHLSAWNEDMIHRMSWIGEESYEHR